MTVRTLALAAALAVVVSVGFLGSAHADWVNVLEIKGTTSTQTKYFSVGNEWALEYRCKGNGNFSVDSVREDGNDSLLAHTIGSHYETTYQHGDPGWHYLKIMTTLEESYWIVVWAWR